MIKSKSGTHLGAIMNDKEFYKKYPRDDFELKHLSYKEKGFKGETEYNEYQLKDKTTGEVVGIVTRKEETVKYGDQDDRVTWSF